MAGLDLHERLALIRAEIDERQRRGGWVHPVQVIAVTKTHGPEAVLAALEAGLTAVGENRVQEATAKQTALTGVAVDWHLIGGLQRNKARHAVGRFALIQSVDRLDLAVELDRRTADLPTASPAVQQVLVQVNCSNESQKGGCEPDDLPALLDAVRALPSLDVRGLMTMAAFTDDEGVQRRTFALLRSLRDAAEQAGHRLPELSMGMSGDFGAAVEEGATQLRLGTALFGERESWQATPST
jgi:pyridoxal phosphate enzyme (YggS family)